MTIPARIALIPSMTMLLSLIIPGGAANAESGDSRGPVLVRAAGRGNPHINFRDGRAIAKPTFEGAPALLSAGSRQSADGLALATADFDEDGAMDLVASSVTRDGSQLVVHFGNVDAVRPNTPAAKQRRAEGTFIDAPFLPSARLFATPERPDFIGTGDFDADGHWDVVTAQDRGASLTLHRGDGAGGFHPHESLPLPGAVTALVTGEINRRDGLTDVVVGVVGEGGAQALVFQAPEGALTAPPQAVALSAEAVDLALGQIDSRHPFDLMVAAANHLIRVRGVDRMADPDAIPHAEDFPQPFPPAALALGDFDADGATDLAMLDDSGGLRTGPAGDLDRFATRERISLLIARRGDKGRPRLVRARVSSLPGDDLIVIGDGHSGLAVVHPGRRNAPATSFEMPGGIAAIVGMRLNVDALDDVVILPREDPDAIVTLPTSPLMTFIVTNTLNSGAGSLRQAILNANATAGADVINFSITGAGPHIISPATPFPAITDPVTIDGTSEPSYLAAPVVELDGILLGVAADGLHVTAGSSTVSGLSIVRFPGPGSVGGNGILIETAGSNIIEDNYLGYALVGLAFPGNSANGVLINNTASNQVRRNVASNNGTGIRILGPGVGMTSNARMNTVVGNKVGTNPAGTARQANFSGIVLEDAPDNTVGGTPGADRNIISGQLGWGLGLIRPNTSGNLVLNNYVGTNAAGTAAISNDEFGIFLLEASTNTIGGTTAGALNLVSGNGMDGIHITDLLAASNRVEGNRIGTNAAGTAAIANARHGVYILGAPDNFVGGGMGAGNLISGNGGSGVFIDGAFATGNRVQGDYIGTDVSGTSSLPNAQHGVRIARDASSNLIGNALTPPRRNRIGFNGLAGIFVEEGAANSIRANAIFSNAALGIDLAPTGGTIVDPLDADTGPNGLQNHPLITRARTTGGSIDFDAELVSEPGQAYSVDFFASSTCDAAGRGEGARFLGSASSTIAGVTGFATIDRDIVAAVAADEQVTATATHPDGSTSEFSLCFTATRAPGYVPLSAAIPFSGLEMFWQAMAGSQTYNLYRGSETDLPNLFPPPSLAPPVNSCLRWSGTSAGTGPILNEIPPPGSLYWYLATSAGIYGESDGGVGTPGTRKLNPSGPCVGANCPHDRCIVGGPLAKTCSACVAQVCAADEFCCDTQWDSFCVEEARTICGSLACVESKGQCNHTLCSFGPPLVPGCDVPPLPQGGCAAQICAADPFCCEEQWDSLCIDQVASACGLNCG